MSEQKKDRVLTDQAEKALGHNGGIGAIVSVGPVAGREFVPPLDDYKNPSPGWTEAEYHCFKTPSSEVTVGYWTGEPGEVSFDEWPYNEVCSILTGRVAVRDPSGATLEFGPGDCFVVPKGWVGSWVTLETSTKMFLAI